MSKTQIRAWLDQEDSYVAQTIRRFGLLIQHVSGPPGPSFAYTVGLFGVHHPELLIFGLPQDLAAKVLNTLGDRILAGETLAPGAIMTFEEWLHRIIPEPVPNPGEIVFAANRYYGRPDVYSVPVLQLSYDDKQGRFPGEPGYANPERQPRPGTFRA